MTETTTETQTQTPEATPAPVAGQSASEKAPAQAPAAPVAEKVEKPSGQEPQKGPADFFRQREAKREKKAQERVAELEQELQKLRSEREKAPQPEKEPEPLFSLEDPEGSFKKMREQAAKDAVEAIKREQQEFAAQTKYVQAAEGAEKYLLTRSHLKEDPKAEAEITKLITEKYIHLAAFDGGKDPQAAAELAYLAWCREKGVVPDMDGLPKASMSATGGRASAGVSPTTPGTGKRAFAKGEVKKYLDEVQTGTPEWQRRLEETEEAYREGRVQR